MAKYNNGARNRLATAGGLVAIVLWSATVAIARSLSEQLGPITAAAAVYSVSGLAALVSLMMCRGKRQRIPELSFKYLFGCGALFVAYMLVLFFAIGRAESRQQVLEVGLLNYLWPALTLLFSLVLLGKKANWILLPGTLLALAGVFLVITHGASVCWQSFFENLMSNPVAYALAFMAAVSWAMYSGLTRKWAGGKEEGAVVLFLPVTAFVLFLIACFLDEPRMWSHRTVMEAISLGLATYAAYTLWDNAMRKGNIVMVATASYLTPLFSTIISCLYLAVMPDERLWVGCGILILGSWLSWRSIKGSSDDVIIQQLIK